MATRYNNRQVTKNDNEFYKKYFEDRNVNFIRQYRTPQLSYPTPRQMRQLQRIGHIWTYGDRFYKLAHKFYGESKYWWVIAWFNKKPTEGHIERGDTIYIPLPLHRILNFFNV